MEKNQRLTCKTLYVTDMISRACSRANIEKYSDFITSQGAIANQTAPDELFLIGLLPYPRDLLARQSKVRE